MQHKLGIASFLVAAALAPAVALGGQQLAPGVSITSTSTSTRVRGSLIGARNSADTLQYIGCQVNYSFGYCWARDAKGTSVQCSSSEAGRMAAMRMVNATSYLDFTIKAGSCTNIEVSNASRYLPATSTGMVALP